MRTHTWFLSKFTVHMTVLITGILVHGSFPISKGLSPDPRVLKKNLYMYVVTMIEKRKI